MRSGLIVTAALATALVSSTALAERYSDDGTAHSRQIKERVLHNDKSGYAKAEKTQAVRTETMSKRIEGKILKRDRGEVLDSYGKSHGTATRSSTTTSKITKSPLAPKEEMAEGSKSTKASSSQGKQVGWSAGGKSIRSYVHFVNDKGRGQQQHHGSTATAMKMRHIANVLLRTAGIFGSSSTGRFGRRRVGSGLLDRQRPDEWSEAPERRLVSFCARALRSSDARARSLGDRHGDRRLRRGGGRGDGAARRDAHRWRDAHGG